MNQMWFFFDFFAQNVKKPFVTFVMKNVRIIITFPLASSSLGFCVFSSFSQRHFADVVVVGAVSISARYI